MFTLRITILTIIIPLNYELCFCGCAHAEYEIEKQCCPMCSPGNHVDRHCTDDTSTSCLPCPPLTFTDEPNGVMKCFPCTACDANRGLRVKKECPQSSDTVCEPLETFYCIDTKKGSCNSAVQHTECSPGQYIKQAGTGSTDTVCADCTDDTYSNGSFSSCLPHTKCEALGLTQTNSGTRSSDSECGDPPTNIVIIVSSVVAILIIITGLSVVTIICIQKKKTAYSSVHTWIQETSEDLNNQSSLTDRKNVDTDSLEEEATSNI